MERSKTTFCLLIFFLLVTFAIFLKVNESKKIKIGNYNVILIIVDDLRPDHLGCYGYSKKISPNIDKLARDSYVFENSFSQAGYTLPSTISILTSVYPVSHNMFFVYKDRLSSRIPTMAEVFSFYDYKTAWFSLLHEPHLDIDAGFGRGFQVMGELEQSLDGLEEIISWIEKNKSKKMFLAIDTRSVHNYSRFFRKINSGKNFNADMLKVNEEYYYKLVAAAKSKKAPFNNPAIIRNHRELFNGVYRKDKENEIEDLLNLKNRYEVGLIRTSLYASFVRDFGFKHHEDWIKAYDTAIEYTDEKLIKSILNKINSSKLNDKTIIIITADHGEAFGEHGLYGHGWNVFDEFIHVPLIIKVPHQKGRKIKALVQNIDIMPTVLELTGIPCPHQAQGKSLFSLFSKTNAPPVHEYIFSGGKVQCTIRSLDWKFIINYKVDDRFFYHLTSDPKEKNNLYDQNRDFALKFESKIKAWEKSFPSYKDKEYSFSPEIDKAVQEKIRKTGYW